MIGSEYQSSVPSGLSPYDNIQTVPYENEDKLLWTPWVLSDSITEEYLQRCALLQQELMRSRLTASASQPLQTLALLASLPMGAHTRDDEQVLYYIRRKHQEIMKSISYIDWIGFDCSFETKQ